MSAPAVRDIVAAHRGQRGALLPILHAVQETLGYVPPEAIPVLAEELNLSRADVHGVVTFYHDFRSAPAGRTTIRICRGEACQATGAERLVSHLRDRCGMSLGETTADGSLTVEQVFCLGNCALGPSGTLDGRLHGRLSGERLDGIRPSPAFQVIVWKADHCGSETGWFFPQQIRRPNLHWCKIKPSAKWKFSKGVAKTPPSLDDVGSQFFTETSPGNILHCLA